MKNNDEKKQEFIEGLNALLLKHDAMLTIEDQSTGGWDRHDPVMVAYIDGYMVDFKLGSHVYPETPKVSGDFSFDEDPPVDNYPKY